MVVLGKSFAIAGLQAHLPSWLRLPSLGTSGTSSRGAPRRSRPPQNHNQEHRIDRHNYFLSHIPLQVRASIGHFILEEEALHEKDFPEAPDAEA